jgi:hypothetical protein
MISVDITGFSALVISGSMSAFLGRRWEPVPWYCVTHHCAFRNGEHPIIAVEEGADIPQCKILWYVKGGEELGLR